MKVVESVIKTFETRASFAPSVTFKLEFSAVLMPGP